MHTLRKRKLDRATEHLFYMQKKKKERKTIERLFVPAKDFDF